MPLIRYTKLPPPPEMGGKTLWQSLPKQSVRRVFFLLLALGAVLFLRGSGGSFGGLFDAIGAGRPGAAPGAPASPVYHIRVTPPAGAPGAASRP
jgi:hypothetical protein